MSKKKHVVAMICDRSGSMGSVIDEAIGGANRYIQEQREDKNKVKMTVVLFDDQYDVIYDNVKAEKVQDFNEESYTPRGMTALNDAIGKTINNLKESISNMKNKPATTTVVVLTDGLENSSQEFSGSEGFEKIKTMVSEQEDAGWQFVFLSADMNAVQQGASYGMVNAVHYAGTHAGTAAVFDAAISYTARSKGGVDLKTQDISSDNITGEDK